MRRSVIGSIALVVTGREHWLLLAVLIGAPQLLKFLGTLQKPKPDERPERYPEGIWPLWFSAHAFAHTRVFTTLFVGALLLSWLYASFTAGNA